MLYARPLEFLLKAQVVIYCPPVPPLCRITRVRSECLECTVCASGYGRGAAKTCHLCTPGFKAVMYAVLVILAALALVVTALLAVYLVSTSIAGLGVMIILDCLGILAQTIL